MANFFRSMVYWFLIGWILILIGSFQVSGGNVVFLFAFSIFNSLVFGVFQLSAHLTATFGVLTILFRVVPFLEEVDISKELKGLITVLFLLLIILIIILVGSDLYEYYLEKFLRIFNSRATFMFRSFLDCLFLFFLFFIFPFFAVSTEEY